MAPGNAAAAGVAGTVPRTAATPRHAARLTAGRIVRGRCMGGTLAELDPPNSGQVAAPAETRQLDRVSFGG
nr:hypothetical protein GCM10020063_004560 [Dactylosporangium thailandense]